MLVDHEFPTKVLREEGRVVKDHNHSMKISKDLLRSSL